MTTTQYQVKFYYFKYLSILEWILDGTTASSAIHMVSVLTVFNPKKKCKFKTRVNGKFRQVQKLTKCAPRSNNWTLLLFLCLSGSEFSGGQAGIGYIPQE